LNKWIFIGVLLIFGTNIFAQKILIVENIHTQKNFKYYQGSKVMLQLSGKKGRIADNIYEMTDSSVIFEGLGELKLSSVAFIYRENWLIQVLRGLSFLGGTAYFGVDSFNRMINHEYPVVQSETLWISGSMVAFSVVLTPFRYRKINISGNWKLKSIDLEAF
jgi:hypothetical protein